MQTRDLFKKSQEIQTMRTVALCKTCKQDADYEPQEVHTIDTNKRLIQKITRDTNNTYGSIMQDMQTGYRL